VASTCEGGRRLLWEGRNGLVGPHSSAAGFQPRGGREIAGGLYLRRTSLPSRGSGGWLRVGRKTSACFSRP